MNNTETILLPIILELYLVYYNHGNIKSPNFRHLFQSFQNILKEHGTVKSTCRILTSILRLGKLFGLSLRTKAEINHHQLDMTDLFHFDGKINLNYFTQEKRSPLNYGCQYPAL